MMTRLKRLSIAISLFARQGDVKADRRERVLDYA